MKPVVETYVTREVPKIESVPVVVTLTAEDAAALKLLTNSMVFKPGEYFKRDHRMPKVKCLQDRLWAMLETAGVECVS